MKSRKILARIIFIALFIIAVSEVHALHELFKDLDLNKDGKVDRSEFSQDMKQNAFKKLDADKSNEILEEEWDIIENVKDKVKHHELFRAIDKNKDRRITFFEFSDYADIHSNISKAFIGLDRDGSNALSPDEISVRPLFRMITIYF